MLAKLSKIARFIILLLLFTVGMLYVLLRSSAVQTWLAEKGTEYLSKELGTKVRISGVDIEFFKTAVLEDLYIEDKHGDTLIYVHRLKIDYRNFDKEKHKISLNKVVFEDAKILFGQHKNDTIQNYEFLIDYFNGGPRDPNKPKVIWTVYGKDVTFVRSRFDLFKEGVEPVVNMKFDYNRLSINNLNAKFRDFYLVDDSMHFQSDLFSFKERSGFTLTNLKGDVKIHEKGIELNEMLLETPNGTKLSKAFAMHTNSWKDYNEFITKVKMEVNLESSVLCLKDIGFFNNNISEYDYDIRLEGKMSGTLGKMKGTGLKVGLLNRTVLQGDWSIDGLPDINEAYIDFKISALETDYQDMKALSHSSDLPSNIKELGLISYSGRFTGFYNDFVAYGNLVTALGNIRSDINLKFKEGIANATYSGHLVTNNFKVNRLVKDVPISTLSFDLNIAGKGVQEKNYKMNLNGSISSIGLNGYTYTNIKTKGNFSPKLFEGELTINDPNLIMAFNGKFDMSGEKPIADFTANIESAKLQALNIDSKSHDLSGRFTLNFTGNTIDNSIGTIGVKNMSIIRNGKTLNLDTAYINSTKDNNNEILTIKSDILDARISGNYTLSELPSSMQEFLYTLLPSFIDPPLTNLPKENIEFDIDLKQPDIITALYLPELSVKPGKITGFYQSENNVLDLLINNDEIIWDGYTVKNIALKARKTSDSLLSINSTIGSFSSNVFKAQDLKIKTIVKNNIISYDLQFTDTGQSVAVNTVGDILFEKEKMTFALAKAAINFEGETWSLKDSTQVQIIKSDILFNQMVFENNSQSLKINGTYSNKETDKLSIDVTDFDLKVVNKITGNASSGIPEIYGIANGNVYLKTLAGRMFVGSDLNIVNLALGKDTIGDMKITSSSRNNSVQNIQLDVTRGAFKGLDIGGNIDFKSKNDNFDLHIKIPESDVNVIEQFVPGLISQVTGKLNVDMILKGTFDKPLLDGKITLNNVNAVVNFLQSRISFSNVIDVNKGEFAMKPFEIFDDKNHTGQVSGKITHNSFSDFRLGIEISRLNNFHALNTTFKDNDLFYGQAFVDGRMSIYGPIDAMDMYIGIKTRADTRLFLPISSGNEAGFPEYVHFKSGKKRIIRDEGLQNIHSFEMDIEATTDATIEIIFDEALGDKIVGSGYGNLKFEIDQAGDATMHGTYFIERGNYLFTLLNIYNKPLTVRPGGKVTWTGNLLEAKLDLTAVNTTWVNPQPLLQSTSTLQTTAAPSKIQAQSELYIKGNLFSPEITFGLQFPNIETQSGTAGNELSNTIRRIKADKEETNRQVFSLLILGNLLTPTFSQQTSGFASAGTGAASNSATDLLSNQLSNWLSKIDPNWRVNIDYKTAAAPTLPQTFAINISTKVLNEKLIVDLGVASGATGPNLSLEYKITQQGNLRVKAYNRAGSNIITSASLSTPINTTGVGIVYQKEFNKFSLKRKNKNKKKKTD